MAFGEKETGEVLFSYETRELPDEQPPLFPQVLILKAHISDSLPLSLSVLSRARRDTSLINFETIPERRHVATSELEQDHVVKSYDAH